MLRNTSGAKVQSRVAYLVIAFSSRLSVNLSHPEQIHLLGPFTPSVSKKLRQLCDDVSNSVLIENNGDAWKWVATPILERHCSWVVTGPVYINCQHQCCVHSAMMIQNGGYNPFSSVSFDFNENRIATVSHNIDADALCKQALWQLCDDAPEWRLQPVFKASPLISMRIESLASSQSCHSVDADA